MHVHWTCTTRTLVVQCSCEVNSLHYYTCTTASLPQNVHVTCLGFTWRMCSLKRMSSQCTDENDSVHTNLCSLECVLLCSKIGMVEGRTDRFWRPVSYFFKKNGNGHFFFLRKDDGNSYSDNYTRYVGD